MLRHFCVLWICLNIAWISAAEIQEIQSGGKTCWRLSTALMEAVVSPEDGGRVIELLDRTSGESLTRFASLAQAPAGSGLFADRIWPKGKGVIRNYETSPYVVVKTKADGQSAEIILRREIAPLSVEKRIILREKERRIQAEYALSNPQAGSFTGTFWSCNVLVPPAKESYKMYLPAGMRTAEMKGTGPVTDNRVDYSLDQPVGANHFINAPEHDYAAVIGARTGAALLMPFACLDHFYSCHPAPSTQSLLVPTLEWFSLPFMLPSYAEGLVNAAQHPELADPLQDYVYRFTVAVEAFEASGFDPARYRPKSNEAKLQRFAPVAEEIPVYKDFQSKAISWVSGADEISLLAVVNADASAEMFEFARRFPIALSLVEVDHPHVFGSHLYFSWPVPEPGERLVRELAKEPQIILLSGTFEKAMPEEARRQLLSRVEAGTPLIYISHDNQFPSLLDNTQKIPAPTDIFLGVPFSSLPVDAPEVELRQYGAGKVYWIKYRLINSNLRWTQKTALTPFFDDVPVEDIPYWEYYFSFYGRLLWDAAGRRPDLRLSDLQFTEKLSMTLQAKREGNADVSVRLDAPRETGAAELHWQGTVTAGDNHVEISLPPEKMLSNGDYFCNARIALDGHGEDWGTAMRTIRGPNALLRLNLDRYSHRGKHPEVHGEVEILGKGDLQLQLRDSYGRVLAHELRQGVSGRQSFKLIPEKEYFLPLADMVATLTVDGTLVDQRQNSLTLEPPERQPLNFVVWTHGSNAWFNRDSNRTISDMGFTVATGGSTNIESAAMSRAQAEEAMRTGLRFAPMSMHRISLWGNQLQGVVRDPCLRDPAYWRKMSDDVKSIVEKVSGSFPFTYYSGDENSLGHYDAAHEFCQSEHCLAAFRGEMKRKYGDLTTLNRLWRRQYSTWEEIRPLTFSEARSEQNIAPWVEHRIFMMRAVSDALGKMKKELLRFDPEARLGFSGQLNTNLHGAFNWQAALQYVDYPTAYLRGSDGLLDLARSFLPQGGSCGAWIGYGVPLPEIRWNYWRQIVNGWFSPSYWWSGYFIRHGDQRLSREGEHLRDVLREIRSSGVDVTLAGSRVETSPFTLVYSIPSLVASAMTGQSSIFNPANYTANFNGWSALLRDLGWQPPQILSCADLATADLSGIQVLILPMTQMLDDRAVTALCRYVEAGGTLLMDAQSALFDGFAQPRKNNPLAALAGIRFEPASNSETGGSLLWEGSFLRAMLTGSQVSLAGGKAFAGIGNAERTVTFGGMQVTSPSSALQLPALVCKRAGKGSAAYLNFLMADYPEIRGQSAASASLRAAMQALLKELRSDLPPAHQLPADCDLLTRSGHGNRYLSIVRHAGNAPPEAHLQLGQSAHVYDTLKHQYLGEFTEMSLEIPAYAVRNLALLPAKNVPMQGNIRWDGEKFRIGLFREGGGSSGVVRLEVWCNDQERRHYAGNHLLSGRLDLTVDPGLFPEAGSWLLRVTDLFDGQVIEHVQLLPEGVR